MRVTLVSTHRADRGHYARLRALLESDARFKLVEIQPDVAVVLGDRFEMLQQAATWVERRVRLIHIHGGEHTYGSLDERYRYAITALADWHCVATENAKMEVERYLITGEWGAGPRRGFTDTYRKTANCVRVTGAPGLDDIRSGRRQIPVAIIWHHNPVIDEAMTRAEAEAIAAALSIFHPPMLLRIAPNGDRFSVGEGVTLGLQEYRDCLASAKVIVGNSSAGIIEAPSLGTWCVNVGERQAGRERAGNVIDVPADAQMIRAAVKDCLGRARYAGPNPYEHPEGKACEAIRDVLLGFEDRAHHRRDGQPRDGASRSTPRETDTNTPSSLT